MYQDKQFYLIIISLIGLTVIFFWSAFFRPSVCKLNGIISLALTLESVLKIKTAFPILLSRLPVNFYHFVLLVINFFQSLILIISFSFICSLLVMGNVFFNHFPVQRFSTGDSMLIFVLLLLRTTLLYLVHLFHLCIFFIFWYSFACILILTGINFVVALTYIVLQFKQNYAQLKVALRKRVKGFRAPLSPLLQRNLFNFGLVFLFDDFLSLQGTAYFRLHIPLSAYFVMRMLFNHVSLLPAILMIGLASEAVFGFLFCHFIWLTLAAISTEAAKC